MGAPVVRPFNSLSGFEVAEIILAEIKRHLHSDYRFRNNIAYPLVTWSWKLAINAYPSDVGQFTVELTDKTARAPQAEIPPEDAPVIEINLGSTRDVSAPAGETADSARRGANLPVPTPRTVKGPGNSRITVDAPAIDIKTTAASASVAEEPTANVSKGGRVFARSVTQRTAAAPQGVEAPEPAGSKPDIERTQEILERKREDEIIEREAEKPAE